MLNTSLLMQELGNKNNSGGNSSQQQVNRTSSNYSSNPNRKRKPDNTVATMERSCKDSKSVDNPHFQLLLKAKCPWHPDNNQNTEQCYQLCRALKDTIEPSHPEYICGCKVKKDDSDKYDGYRSYQHRQCHLRQTTHQVLTEAYPRGDHVI
jgi:hypothetical protein